MLVIFNIMVIYLLEVECKVYLLYLILGRGGHGHQLPSVLKINAPRIDTTIKGPQISKTQVIQKLLIMASVVLKGGLSMTTLVYFKILNIQRMESISWVFIKLPCYKPLKQMDCLG